MFWNKKKEKPKEEGPPVIVNRLTIFFRDGSWKAWSEENWKGSNRVQPWIHFYKWFFGKSGEYYVMKYDTGEHMFLRKDIKSFTVSIIKTN